MIVSVAALKQVQILGQSNRFIATETHNVSSFKLLMNPHTISAKQYLCLALFNLGGADSVVWNYGSHIFDAFYFFNASNKKILLQSYEHQNETEQKSIKR